MQKIEIARRAGLILLNLTYGTTINLIKSAIYGGYEYAKEQKALMEQSNVLDKITIYGLICLSFFWGAFQGLGVGINDFTTNFNKIINEGNYNTHYSFKNIFYTKAFIFKYKEPLEVAPQLAPTGPAVAPEPTPTAKFAEHFVSL